MTSGVSGGTDVNGLEISLQDVTCEFEFYTLIQGKVLRIFVIECSVRV